MGSFQRGRPEVRVCRCLRRASSSTSVGETTQRILYTILVFTFPICGLAAEPETVQMDDMLKVQAAVAEQMASMERRLQQLHAPLQERLRLYEVRISELESQLARRGEENRLLLQAQIDALRHHMELEREAAEFN